MNKNIQTILDLLESLLILPEDVRSRFREFAEQSTDIAKLDFLEKKLLEAKALQEKIFTKALEKNPNFFKEVKHTADTMYLNDREQKDAVDNRAVMATLEKEIEAII